MKVLLVENKKKEKEGVKNSEWVCKVKWVRWVIFYIDKWGEE